MLPILDEIMVDQAPTLRTPWIDFFQMILMATNVLMLGAGVGLGLWMLWFYADWLSPQANVFSAIGLVVYTMWSWTVTMPAVRYMIRWRYCAKVYESTWVKQRFREMSNRRPGIACSTLLFGIFPFGLLFYLQFLYAEGPSLPYWTYGFWVLWLLWGPVQWRHFHYMERKRELVLTTKAPSSHSRFAPKHKK